MAKKATLSLKPIVAELKSILTALKKEAKKKGLTKAQKKGLAKDIKNVQKLIVAIPPNCHTHTPPYDMGL